MGLLPVSSGSALSEAQAPTSASPIKPRTNFDHSTLTRSEEGKSSESSSLWSRFVNFVKWFFCCCGLCEGSEAEEQGGQVKIPSAKEIKVPSTREELERYVEALPLVVMGMQQANPGLPAEGVTQLKYLASYVDALLGVEVQNDITKEDREKLFAQVKDFVTQCGVDVDGVLMEVTGTVSPEEAWISLLGHLDTEHGKDVIAEVRGLLVRVPKFLEAITAINQLMLSMGEVARPEDLWTRLHELLSSAPMQDVVTELRQSLGSATSLVKAATVFHRQLNPELRGKEGQIVFDNEVGEIEIPQTRHELVQLYESILEDFKELEQAKDLAALPIMLRFAGYTKAVTGIKNQEGDITQANRIEFFSALMTALQLSNMDGVLCAITGTTTRDDALDFILNQLDSDHVQKFLNNLQGSTDSYLELMAAMMTFLNDLLPLEDALQVDDEGSGW